MAKMSWLKGRKEVGRAFGLLLDDRGSSFVENGLWIALIVLTLAVAGYGLAKTLNGKYTETNTSVSKVTVPQIQ